MKPIVYPAIFDSMTPRKDKSWKLIYETRELYGDDIKKLGDLLGTELWMLIAPNKENLDLEDIPKEEADAGLEGGKSLSQRLYNTMFVYWKHLGQPGGDFQGWRRIYIERIMDQMKAKLPPREAMRERS